MSVDLQQSQQSSEEVAAKIPGLTEDERKKAAVAIQRTYRGHRTRRAFKGHALDPDLRWTEAIRDAQFRQATGPHGPDDAKESHPTLLTTDATTGRVTPARADDTDAHQTNAQSLSPFPARKQWQRVGRIALRAGADDPDTDSMSESDSDETDSADEHFSPNGRPISKDKDEKMAQRQRRAQARNDRKKTAKMMDLQYFLEMVDHKHRYGSNLRSYHNVWKTAPTSQNFFYWLDHGEGKDLDLPHCSRERLMKEQVRYLSREERLDYLVKVDKLGRLVWAKNGERVSTLDDTYRDSIHGIVPLNSTEPRFREFNENGELEAQSVDSSASSDEDGDAHGEADHYVDHEFKKAKGPSKIAKVSPAVIFNHLIRSSIKHGNKWIFVADTSFRLYIGIKQSGAFQHSSFLHGARVSAAGLIKVKDGQLRSLAPLSGHYRPPAANFRAFVHSLKDEGVDLSHVSISKSYAVLVGIEGYTKTRKKIKKAEDGVKHNVIKIIHPEKYKEEQEKQRDKTESAQKEREALAEVERRAREEKERRKNDHFSHKLMKKLHLSDPSSADTAAAVRNVTEKEVLNTDGAMDLDSTNMKSTNAVPPSSLDDPLPSPQGIPGPAPEQGVPAPEGHR